MIIGVPTEIKPQENRIGAVPAMVMELVEAGNTVLVERGGGLGAGIQLSLIHIPSPRDATLSRMPSSA